MGKVVLAVGAHRYDVEIGCASILKEHKEKGDEVYGLVLSRCKTGDNCPIKKRYKSSSETPILSGITLLNFKEGEIEENERTISTIRKYIEMYQPEKIYSHKPDDECQAHRNVSLATAVAANGYLEGITLFEYPSATIPASSPSQFFAAREYARDEIEAAQNLFSKYEKKQTGRTVLAVGAHPDDIELGCGGTLRRHKEMGDSVYGLVISRGEMGNHCADCKECENSTEVLGLDGITILNFEDTNIMDNGDTISAIDRYILMYNPTIVYGHTENDRHQDHRNVSFATRSSARGHGKSIFFFESPSALTNFSPHHFVILSEAQLNKKIEALRNYQSQLAKNSVLNLEWIIARAKYWGYMETNGRGNGDIYAEVFESNHTVWTLESR